MVAAGTERVQSAMPQIMGQQGQPNPEIFKMEPHALRHGASPPRRSHSNGKVSCEDPGMRLRSEAVLRACAAISAGQFADRILPYVVKSLCPGVSRDGTVYYSNT